MTTAALTDAEWLRRVRTLTNRWGLGRGHGWIMTDGGLLVTGCDHDMLVILANQLSSADVVQTGLLLDVTVVVGGREVTLRSAL